MMEQEYDNRYFSIIQKCDENDDNGEQNNEDNHTLTDVVLRRYDFENEFKRIKSAMFVDRSGFASVAINKTKDQQQIIVLGGFPRTDIVESYDMKTQEWKQLCPIPVALNACAAINLDNYNVYVFGGDNIHQNTNTFYKYNITNNTWTTLCSMKTIRTGLAGLIIEDKIYAIGGCDGLDKHDTIEFYDTSASRRDSWELLPAKMNTKRSFCCAVAIGNTIYVIGGVDGHFSVLNTVEMHDTSQRNSEWIQISATMNTKRTCAAAIALGYHILIIGGQDEYGNELSTIEIFNTKINAFVTRSNNIQFPLMTTERSRCAAVLVNDNINSDEDAVSIKKVVVIGGLNNAAARTTEMIGVETITIEMPKLNMLSDAKSVITSFLVEEEENTSSSDQRKS